MSNNTSDVKKLSADFGNSLAEAKKAETKTNKASHDDVSDYSDDWGESSP